MILAAHWTGNVDEWHILFVALMWLAAVPVLAYSYTKVSTWRRPLYLLALPVVATMGYIYAGYVLEHVFDVNLPGDPALLLRIALFLLATEFYLVPYVDRLENRTKKGTIAIELATEAVKSKLEQDQQDTMDEQHLVMGEQREVMDEQRLTMHPDEGDQDAG